MRTRYVLVALPLIAAVIVYWSRAASNETGRADRAATPVDPTESDRRSDDHAELTTIRVLRAVNDAPIEGARVALVAAGDRIGTAGTDGRGRATLSRPAGRDIEFRISHERYLTEVYYYRARDPSTVTIRLRASATLRGRAVRHGSTEPVRSAEIETSIWPHDALIRTLTDDDGRFALGGLVPGGTVHLSVRSPGYARLSGWYSVDDDAQIVLGNGGTIRGIVVDERRRPAAGARVLFLKAYDPPIPLARYAEDDVPEAITQSDGTFEIRGLRGESYIVLARADGFQEGVHPAVAFEPASTPRTIQIELKRKAHVIIRVVRPDGSPASGGLVTLADDLGRFVEGDPGVYVCGPIEAGRHDGSIQLPDWGTLRFRCQADIVAPPVQEVLLLAGELIRGMVTDASGEPLRAIQVRYRSNRQDAETESNEQGRFLLQGLGREPGTLAVESLGSVFIPQKHGVTPGGPEVSLVLEKAPAITGRVDPPPVDRELQFRIGGTRVPFDSATVRVDANGRFRLRGMPGHDRFLLALHVEGWVPLVFSDVSLEPGSHRDLGILRPPEGVTLEGVVRDNRGEFVDGAAVNLESPLQDVREFQLTDATGRFRFEDLPESPATLSIGSHGHVPRTIPCRLATGETIDIVLIRAGRLEATIDIESTDVTLVPLEHGEPTVFRAEGGVLSANVAPGRYRIRFLNREGPIVEVTEGETVRVALETR